MANPNTFRDYNAYVKDNDGIRGVDLADETITKDKLDPTASGNGWDAVPGGTIDGQRLVAYDTSGVLKEASAGCTFVAGVNVSTSTITTSDSSITVGVGVQKAIADSALAAGYKIKAATDGKVTLFIDSNLASTVIATITSYGSFPATAQTTAGISVVSASTADTTTVTVYYISASGTAVNVDTLTLTGTVAVTSTVTSPGNLLGIELGAVCSGTITIARSGSGAITTITAGLTSKGVVTITATLCYDSVPYVYCTAANTALASVIGISIDDHTTTAYGTAATLNGTAGVTTTTKMNTIHKVLTGDSAVGIKVTLSTTETSTGTCIGRTLEAATAADEAIDVYLNPLVV